MEGLERILTLRHFADTGHTVGRTTADHRDGRELEDAARDRDPMAHVRDPGWTRERCAQLPFCLAPGMRECQTWCCLSASTGTRQHRQHQSAEAATPAEPERVSGDDCSSEFEQPRRTRLRWQGPRSQARRWRSMTRGSCALTRFRRHQMSHNTGYPEIGGSLAWCTPLTSATSSAPIAQRGSAQRRPPQRPTRSIATNASPTGAPAQSSTHGTALARHSRGAFASDRCTSAECLLPWSAAYRAALAGPCEGLHRPGGCTPLNTAQQNGAE